jgi:hypothetical protein
VLELFTPEGVGTMVTLDRVGTILDDAPAEDPPAVDPPAVDREGDAS